MPRRRSPSVRKVHPRSKQSRPRIPWGAVLHTGRWSVWSTLPNRGTSSAPPNTWSPASSLQNGRSSQNNCGSFWTASCSRPWIASATSRTEISTMGRPTGIVSVLSKARPAMSRSFWTVCSEVKAPPSGCSPPAHWTKSPGCMRKSNRGGSKRMCPNGCAPFDSCPYHSIAGSPSFLSSPWSSLSPHSPLAF